MPRSNTPTVKLCLTTSQAALSLNLRPEHIRQATLEGKIIARQFGARRLIAIGGEGGLQQWLESWPIAVTKPKPKKEVSHGRV